MTFYDIHNSWCALMQHTLTICYWMKNDQNQMVVNDDNIRSHCWWSCWEDFSINCVSICPRNKYGDILKPETKLSPPHLVITIYFLAVFRIPVLVPNLLNQSLLIFCTIFFKSSEWCQSVAIKMTRFFIRFFFKQTSTYPTCRLFLRQQVQGHFLLKRNNIG